jgi:hypothetical protein
MPTPRLLIFPARAEHGVMTEADVAADRLTWDEVSQWLSAAKYWGYHVTRRRPSPRPGGVGYLA